LIGPEDSALSPVVVLVSQENSVMHGIIYLVGLVVVIMAILSFFGLR